MSYARFSLEEMINQAKCKNEVFSSVFGLFILHKNFKNEFKSPFLKNYKS